MTDTAALETIVVPVVDQAIPEHRDVLPRAIPRSRPIRSHSRSTPSALLPLTPAIFPWLERRFSPGETTLWIGPDGPVTHLLERLYIGVASAGGSVSLIEGANRIRPYDIAEACRSLGIDATPMLERVRLARAFTTYQLVALVDGWKREIRRHRPTLLVGHDLPALFASDEFPAEERAPLLTHVARTLRTIAEESGLPLLLTLPGDPAGFPGLSEEGPRWCDVVRFRPGGPGAVRLEAYRASAQLSLVARPGGQRGLEEFDPEVPEEVTEWDGRTRRTARRSRSG